MKQYIGFVRDHSGSMQPNAEAAKEDYNAQINAIREQSIKHQLDTIIFTAKFGLAKGTEFEAINSTVHLLKPITDYETYATTDLFDAVGNLIEMMKSVPDFGNPGVSFLLNVTTDGMENASRKWSGNMLSEEIKRLQASDVWTFTFRTPPGQVEYLSRMLNIPAGNMMEWSTDPEGMREATKQTVNAYSNFFQQRSTGVKSSRSFYADLSGVSSRQVRDNLDNITDEVKVLRVKPQSNKAEIRTFVEMALGNYKKGAAFYELSKPETVQDNKKIIIRNKVSQNIYAGGKARQYLGLPETGDVRLRPGDNDKFDVFVQSTSVNRKVVRDTDLIYWEGAVR